MWGLAIDWTAGHKLATAMPLDRSGAITASVLAGIWWSVLLVLRHLGNKALLIRTLADAAPVQPAARKTLPLPRLRVL